MPRRYPSLPSACYVYSNQRMICRINSRKVYHYVFLELREIGIGNFQILSMLFSYLHVAFPRSLGHGDAATCCLCRRPEGNVLSSTCLLRLFEISLANDRTEIVVFSFYAGKYPQAKIRMQRRLCSRLYRPQEVTCSPSACFVCSNQRMISRIREDE